jgi:hypothetical protein
MLNERERLLQKISNDLRKKTSACLAAEIGITAMTLGRIIRKKSRGSVGTWDTITAYYRKRTRKASA